MNNPILEKETLRFRFTLSKNRAIVGISGSICNIENGAIISRQIDWFFKAQYPIIIVDLTCVPFISASFCGILASCQKAATEKETQFGIVAMSNSSVRDMLEICGMKKVIAIYSSREELPPEWNSK